jgi:hypothetical protein
MTDSSRVGSSDRNPTFRHAACDELLQAEEEACNSDDEVVAYDEGNVTVEDLLVNQQHLSGARLKEAKRKAKLIRAIALICTCSLSIGSH